MTSRHCEGRGAESDPVLFEGFFIQAVFSLSLSLRKGHGGGIINPAPLRDTHTLNKSHQSTYCHMPAYEWHKPFFTSINNCWQTGSWQPPPHPEKPEGSD